MLAILLFSITAVSASDDGDNLQATDDEDIISDEGTRSVGYETYTFSDLQKLINESTDNSVTLKHDYAFDRLVDTNDGIMINKSNFVLDGAGYTVDGQSVSKIFIVNATNVTLKNLIITNGYISNLHIFESDDYNSYNMDNGAAIAWYGDDGVLSNTTISNNVIVDSMKWKKVTASVTLSYVIGNGAGVYWKGNNGLIETSRFYNNKVLGTQQVIESGTTATVSRRTTTQGGGLYMDECQNFRILESNFDNNSASGNGGAITLHKAYNVTIDANMSNSLGGTDGGAIYLTGGSSYISINGTFKNNVAPSGGGVLFFHQDAIHNYINVSGEFIENECYGGASAVWFYGESRNVIVDANFTNNKASGGNGALSFNRPVINVTVSGNFRDNEGNTNAGALVFASSSANVTLSANFYDNYVLTNSAAAVVFAGAATNVNVTGTYERNNAKNNGGAIYFSSTATNVNLSGTFKDNYATHKGGAVYFNSVANTINVPGTFINNTALEGGSAIYFANTANDVTVSGDFERNKGGSVIVSNSDITISNEAIFSDNDGVDYGKPVTMTINTFYNVIQPGDNLYINITLKQGDTLISGNVELTIGEDSYGVISISNGVGEKYVPLNIGEGTYDVTLEYKGDSALDYSGSFQKRTLKITSSESKSFTDLNNTINGNNNQYVILEGDYVYKGVDSGLVSGIPLRSNLIIDGQNKTTIDGSNLARIFITSSAVENITIKDVKIINAYAEDGSVVCFENTVTNLTLDGTFEDNYASNRGSIAYFNGVTKNVTFNGKYNNNQAKSSGIAYFYTTAYNIVFSGNFNNTIGIDPGAAICFRSKSYNLTFSGVFNNSVGYSDGGVILIAGVDDATFNGVFENTRLNRFYGGVARIDGTSSNIVLSGNFTNNSARFMGGAVFFGGVVNTLNITGNFINNSALIYGGAVATRSTANNVYISGKFINNNALIVGAVYLVDGETLTVENTLFENNSAGVGAGLSASISNMKIENTEFVNNTANFGAGAIISSDDAEITNTNFTGNSANSGAGLVTSGDSVSISNSNFKSNQATDSGAGVINTGSDLSVDACHFEENTAGNGESDIASVEEVTITHITFNCELSMDINNIILGETLTITGHLSDSMIGAEIDILGDGVKIGTVTVNNNIFTFDWQPTTNGPHTLSLATTDQSGNTYNYNVNEFTFSVVPDTSFTALQALLERTPMLDLTKDYIYDATYDGWLVNGLELKRYITINGDGHSIDGLGTARIFNVSADNVKLANLTLKNANANAGGAIYWQSAAVEGNISNCTFTNNNANSYSNVYSETTELVLENNTFNTVTASFNTINPVNYGSAITVTGTFDDGNNIDRNMVVLVNENRDSTANIANTFSFEIDARLPNTYSISFSNIDENNNRYVFTTTPIATFTVNRLSTVYIAPSSKGNNNGVDEDNATTWDNVVDIITSTGTVYFTDDDYSMSNIEINNAWTLTASSKGNAVITGDSTNSIFIVKSTGVTINNLKLTNGNVAPISVDEAVSSVSVTNSELQNQIELTLSKSSYIYDEDITITGSFGKITPSTITAKSGETTIGTSTDSIASYTITRTDALGVGSYAVTTNKT